MQVNQHEHRCVLHSRDEIIIIHGATTGEIRERWQMQPETFAVLPKDELFLQKVCIVKLLPRLWSHVLEKVTVRKTPQSTKSNLL